MKQNLKIGIVGYGQMGREVESVAISKGITITDKFDIYQPLDENAKYSFDVAIEFTHPDSVIKNIEILAKLSKHIVIGTTGWYHKINEVRKIAENHNIGIVWASNFSLGMNVFFKIIKFAAHLFNNLSDYDVLVNEIHHKLKKDYPSGTAIKIGNILLEEVKNKNEITNVPLLNSSNQINISSTRGGYFPGTHSVYFDSFADTIEITHSARNRIGFAQGAVEAAVLISKKKGFYEFSDLLDDIFK
jgi:4-hydroxy-tetrahydrodipicolinate reductase